MTDTFAGSHVRHGTHSGWSKHQDLGERPCDPCWRAKSDYDKRRKNTPLVKLKNRAHARAQQKAYQRLAHKYNKLYRQYYVEEKAIALREAGLEDAI
jgi:hypothetical protein